jgi:hypothetical protein
MLSEGTRSLMPTNSISGLFRPARKTNLPIRPNPLMATLILAMLVLLGRLIIFSFAAYK